jgi:hypothetical protein
MLRPDAALRPKDQAPRYLMPHTGLLLAALPSQWRMILARWQRRTRLPSRGLSCSCNPRALCSPRLPQSSSAGRVGGKRGADVSVDLSVFAGWYHRSVLFSPPLSEPCMQLSLHTALQYRGLGFSSGLDLFESDQRPRDRQPILYRYMASSAQDQRLPP